MLLREANDGTRQVQSQKEEKGEEKNTEDRIQETAFTGIGSSGDLVIDYLPLTIVPAFAGTTGIQHRESTGNVSRIGIAAAPCFLAKARRGHRNDILHNGRMGFRVRIA